MAQQKQRLDLELIAQGFFETQEQALRAIMAGLVFDDASRRALPKAGMQVVRGRALYVKGYKAQGTSYVSRGGLKLKAALECFGLEEKLAGLKALDIGCSTGGFTDCLLQAKLALVYAVDVGYAQFDWALRNDKRVRLFERTNICDLPEILASSKQEHPCSFDLAVADVSFTSLVSILPAVSQMLAQGAYFVPLIKPQFEARKDQVEAGGIVRDPLVHQEVLERICKKLVEAGFLLEDLCRSPIQGAKGNIEFFALAHKSAVQDKVEPAIAQHIQDRIQELCYEDSSGCSSR